MINIDLVVKSRAWAKEEYGFIEKISEKLIKLSDLNLLIKKNIELDLTIFLVSDIQIKKLNNKYRNKDKATDVLSFPTTELKFIDQKSIENFKMPYFYLGDIFLSYQTIKNDAKSQLKTFKNHVTHLILHSILHLIGYDHIKKNDAEIMENKEIAILSKMNIENPYIIKQNAEN